MPDYTDGFKLLQFEDLEIFNRYKQELIISDLGFTQLYAWQEVFENRYKIIDGYLCMFYKMLDGSLSCYAPLGSYHAESFNNMIQKLEAVCYGMGISLRIDFIPENCLDRLRTLTEYEIDVSYDSIFSDYIYHSSEFLCLTGHKNEHKRYLINYFKNHFTYEYQVLNSNNLRMAYKIMDNWCENKNCQSCFWGCEKRALYRILDKWEYLECKGCVILVDGLPKAFMIGEQISKNVVVSHFQKADHSIKGLYPYLSLEFFKKEYSDIPYINLQEDMGIENIKQSKMFYKPSCMYKKYSVSLRRYSNVQDVKEKRERGWNSGSSAKISRI